MSPLSVKLVVVFGSIRHMAQVFFHVLDHHEGSTSFVSGSMAK